MKKLFAIGIFLLFIIPLISSVDFEMKEEFDKGETLIAKISGNFLDPIAREDVFFYRGHVRIPTVYEVSKINDDFYIYALLTGREKGDYAIIIKNIEYMKGIDSSTEHLVKNFSVTGYPADFSIEPGFVEAYENFSIEVQNLQDSEISIQIKIDNETLERNIKSGEKKDLNFGTKGISAPETKFIELFTDNTSYNIPVFIQKNETISEETEGEFRFESSILEVQMSTNSDTRRVIYIHNTGEVDMEDVILYTSPLLEPFVIPSDEVFDIEKNSSKRIELSIASDNTEKIIEGEIIAETPEGILISMTLVLDFIEDFIPLDGSREEPISTLTCEEEGGAICGSEEECEGEILYATDGVCCTGECKETDGGVSRGRIIGWLIIIFLIILVFWFFKSKYFGVRRDTDLLRRKK
jgi:hypothetical protein